MILDALLRKTGTEDSVIFVGSGLLNNPDAIAPDAGCILMFEPDPNHLSALQFYSGMQDNFQLIEASLAARSGIATYHRFNMPELDGFSEVSALQTVFEEVQEIASFEADCLSVADLAQRLPKQHRSGDILILGLLAEEADFLTALEDSGVLSRLSHIVLQTPRPASGSAQPGQTAESWLAERLFDQMLEVPASHPEVSMRILVRNPLGAKLADLSGKIAQQQKDLVAANSALNAERKAAEDKLNKAKAEAQTNADALREKLAAANSALNAERKAAEDKLNKAKAEAQTNADALREKLAAANSALDAERKAAEDKLNKAKAEAQTNADALREKLAAANSALDAERKAAEDKLNKAKAEAQTNADALREKLAAANSALNAERKTAEDKLNKAKAEAQTNADALREKLAAANSALDAERKAAEDKLGKAKAEAQTNADALREKLAAANSALDAERKTAEDKLNKAKAEAQTNADALREKLAAANSALDAERKAAEDKLGKAKAEAQTNADALREKLAAANSALDAERKTAEDKLNKAKAEAQTNADALREKLAAANSALDAESKAAEDKLGKARAETNQARKEQRAGYRDLSLALRGQALREADLKDLQNRFATLVDEKTAQDELLSKLTVRLDRAARYLDQIESLPEAQSAKAALASSVGKGSGGKPAAARKKRNAHK
ncbi:hypothetical protein [Puniceibacterium sp. IMCC21224]|uniref:hypothetical protein n=1 Tax=Puniceibacterium sp. IMCC21224 TaxID=1618204 RepID=UPI00064D7B1A|nr:hypothetical protein [Puniceibacterium sp. IMCC21224]KMK63956.1 hypothetical protein IMCC21224_1614 [Puniceibacterium sp. IMCC21224]